MQVICVSKRCHICEELETWRESYAGSMEMNPSGSAHVRGAKNIVANFLLVFGLKNNE